MLGLILFVSLVTFIVGNISGVSICKKINEVDAREKKERTAELQRLKAEIIAEFKK